MHSNFANVFRETKNAVSERIALRSAPHRSPFGSASLSVHSPFVLRLSSVRAPFGKRKTTKGQATNERTIFYRARADYQLFINI